MPIFMDRHDVQGVTAEEVAKVHQEDLKIQDKYSCRALTYWFDAKRGTAFCLIEAPDRKAVKEMHDEAHGLMPHRIIEVNRSIVEAFLGRIEDPDTSGDAGDLNFPVFQDPAFRSIMFIELKDAALLLSEVGSEKGQEIFNDFNKIIQKACRQHNGQIIQSTYDGFVTTFTSVSKSVDCALAIQKLLKEQNSQHSKKNTYAGIGINAGQPVTESDGFFGDAILLAKRLCYIAVEGEIKVSSNIREQYKKEKLGILPKEISLKSLDREEEQFLTRLMGTTDKIWNQKGVKVKDFCSEIGISKSQFYRKITDLTGQSPTEFMNEFRLKKAIELIEKQPGNITRVALETGFNNPSYFSKCFKEKFGLLPSEYRDKLN